jgi:hypothetical protein
MPVYDKNKTRALFKQLNQFKKIIDQERVNKYSWYRQYVREIIKNLRKLIKESIPIDHLDWTSRWDDERKFALGTLLGSSVFAVSQYWPDSIKKAIKENDYGQLRSKKNFYYINKKYYSTSDYFMDAEGTLREVAKYYQGVGNVAYSKEKYVCAIQNGRYYIKKQNNKPKYEKKIPNMSSITLGINKWSRCTREFVWSMFEYDGKALPDLTRELYGFSFKNIKKLKFTPTKEHLDILTSLEENSNERLPDDITMLINIYAKEKAHKKAISFLRSFCYAWSRIKIKTIQEKLDALGKVADLKEDTGNELH